MRIINKIEISLLVLFLIAYIGIAFNPLIELKWIAVAVAFILGILYFPLGFYTLGTSNNERGESILLGVVHSLTFVAIIFSIIQIHLSLILLQLLIPIYFILVIVALFTKKYINRKDWLLRPLSLLLLVLYAYVTYRL